MEIPAKSGHGTARTYSDYHGIEITLHLPQNFRSGIDAMGFWIIGVGKLVDEIRVRDFGSEALGIVLVIFRVAFLDV